MITQDQQQQRSISLMMESMHQITAAINRVDFASALPMAKSLVEFISAAAAIKQSAEPKPGVLLQGLDCAIPGQLRQSMRVLLQSAGVDPKTGVMKVSGTATTGDVLNSKNEVYPWSVWKSNLAQMKTWISQGKFIGESMHPADGRVSLDRTCLRYTDVWLDESEKQVKFEADLLPTVPHGKNLQLLIENGIAVDISSRGSGSIKPGKWQGTQAQIVQPDFVCTGFDAVVSGSSPGSSVENFSA